MTPIDVTRSEVGLAPDPRRRIAKPYLPGDHGQRDGRSRAEELLERILALSPEEMENTLQGVRDGFSGRHRDLDGILHQGFSAVAQAVHDPAGISDDMRRLIQSLEEEMHEAAKELRFEYAARLRDEVEELRRELREIVDAH